MTLLLPNVLGCEDLAIRALVLFFNGDDVDDEDDRDEDADADDEGGDDNHV